MGGIMTTPTAPPQHPPQHSMAIPRHVMATPTAPQRPRHLGLGLELGLHGMVCQTMEVRGKFRGMPWSVRRKWSHNIATAGREKRK